MECKTSTYSNSVYNSPPIHDAPAHPVRHFNGRGGRASVHWTINRCLIAILLILSHISWSLWRWWAALALHLHKSWSTHWTEGGQTSGIGKETAGSTSEESLSNRGVSTGGLQNLGGQGGTAGWSRKALKTSEIIRANSNSFYTKHEFWSSSFIFFLLDQKQHWFKLILRKQ